MLQGFGVTVVCGAECAQHWHTLLVLHVRPWFLKHGKVNLHYIASMLVSLVLCAWDVSRAKVLDGLYGGIYIVTMVTTVGYIP